MLPQIRSYSLLEGAGTRTHLILFEKDGTEHAVRADVSGGNLSYGVCASGPNARQELLDLAEALVEGLDDVSMTPVFGATPPQGLIDRMSTGRFAVVFPSGPVGLEQDFLQYLKRTLRQWVLDGSGRDKPFGILKHPYWPRFHQQVVESLTTQFGPIVTLYRGIHGDQAQKVEDTLPVWRFSSWSTSRAMAQDFAVFGYTGNLVTGWVKKIRRKGPWAVFEVKVPTSAVVFAPVPLPHFPEPDILVKTFTAQSEMVLDTPAMGIKGKVVARSRPRL